MPSIGPAGGVPRLKVSVGLQEYSQDAARKSMNLPNGDQFLISGGSIDKYLKNNFGTPKGKSQAQDSSPQDDLVT